MFDELCSRLLLAFVLARVDIALCYATTDIHVHTLACVCFGKHATRLCVHGFQHYIHFAGADSASKSRSLPRHLTADLHNQIAYSSADEEYTKRGGGSKVGSRQARLRNRDEKKPSSSNRSKMVDRGLAGSGVKSRPSRLALQHSVNDPTLSRSHDSLVGVASNTGKRKTKSHFLPNVVKSSTHSGTQNNSIHVV